MENVVRVKWPGGYIDVSDGGTGYRRTIPFDAGNVRNRDAAIQAGWTVLQQYGAMPRRSYQVQVGDTPAWPETGDGVSTVDIDGTTATQRIVGRRVSITNTGFAQLEPTLASRQDQLVTRTQLQLKQLTNGAVGGRSSAGEPLQMVESNVLTGQLSETQTLTWSYNPIREKYAAIEKTTEDTCFTRLQVLMTSNKKIDDQNIAVPDTLPGSILFTININDVSVGPLYYPANHAAGEYNWLGGNYWPKETKFQIGIIDYNYPTNPSLDLKNRTMTFKLLGVSGTFIRENKITPEIR